MKIFLDENMPEKLLPTLRAEGHGIESVHSIGIVGTKNGELYKVVRDQYDLLFTKDFAFNEWAKRSKEDDRIKFVLVTLPQKAQDSFVAEFIEKFRKTDWIEHVHGNAWPK